VKVVENEPVDEVVADATLEPAYATVTLEEEENPEPVTVTDVPLGPLGGTSDDSGEATTKVVEAELLAESLAVTVLDPTGEEEGTVKEADKEPFDSVVPDATLEPS